MKQCTKCEATKSIDKFYKDKKTKDGYGGHCKVCQDQYTRDYYDRKLRKRENLLTDHGKICKICRVEKSLSEFNIKHGTKKLSYRNECKKCESAWKADHYKTIAVKERKKRKVYYKDNLKKHHHWYLTSKFGIGRDDYERMLAEQNGKCAICGTGRPYPNERIKNFAVDHDHETGKIRALLCSTCNTGIGHLKHSPGILRKAATYLESFD